MQTLRTPRVVRFGTFEANLNSHELRKNGLKLRLHDQPFQVLELLLEHPGELVTRDMLRQKLWPADTFVDFDNGLSGAINRLREALGDSAENPRFVETLPRRGYRFIAPVEAVVPGIGGRQPPITAAPGSTIVEGPPGLMEPRGTALGPGLSIGENRTKTTRAPYALALGAVAAVLVALLVGLNVAKRRDRPLTTAAAHPIQSLAVLPLENLSSDPEQEYFADGMTEALITDLGKLGTLRVISRTSAMHYKKSKRLLPEIARELNVDAVVEGAVLRSGNRVRITAQLIRAVPETHLWSESYERDLQDVLGLQSKVAGAIAEQVAIKLTPQDQAQLARARPVNPEAYEAYLKGRYFWNLRTEKALRKGIEYFQQAIQKDPNYAPAYAGLAECYNGLGTGILLAMLPKQAAAGARSAALKALELDDTLGEAHAALGMLKFSYDWDWAGAEQEFRRAIALSPSYATAYHWYALFLRAMGRPEESLTMIRRAEQLDPLSTNIAKVVGLSLAEAGHYDEAFGQLRRALELDPNRFNTHAILGVVYLRLGRNNDAVTEFEKAVDLSDGNWAMRANVAYTYALSGRRTEAERILIGLKSRVSQQNLSYQIALVCAALGRRDEALQWLNKAFEERSIRLADRNLAFWFGPLRSDPRFQDLVRRMHFPEVATGK